MMTVIAKFRCELKDPGETGKVTLRVVTSGSKENEEFFFFTPAGEITMQTLNPSAFAQFSVGDEYYVRFTKVETTEPLAKDTTYNG